MARLAGEDDVENASKNLDRFAAASRL